MVQRLLVYLILPKINFKHIQGTSMDDQGRQTRDKPWSNINDFAFPSGVIIPGLKTKKIEIGATVQQSRPRIKFQNLNKMFNKIN